MTRRKTAALGMAAVLLLALTGCLSLPTSGPVNTGVDVAPPDGGLEMFAPGPAEDASPGDIVEGFLLAASTGLGDDFDRSREFLTEEGAANWNPLGGVTVYSTTESLVVTASSDADTDRPTSVTVSVPVEATVDSVGVYTQAPAGTIQNFEFRLEQSVSDQWRITGLDAGVLMSSVTFGNQYRDAPVYFLSTDDPRRLVPDLRFVPRSGSGRALVRALLGGPSEWLRPGVITAFPDGTDLAIDGVSFDDRVASVSLSTEMLSANAALRALASVQLQATLGQLQQAGTVELRVADAPLAVDRSLADVAATPVPSRSPIVISPDGLARVSGSSLELIDGAVPPPVGLHGVALSYGDGPSVGLADSGTLVTLETSAVDQIALLAPGYRLLAPSYDVQGWVWTGSAEVGIHNDTLTALDPISGRNVQVAAPDLDDEDLIALRVSREGARIAYIVRDGDAVRVFVAAIARTPEGQPESVGAGRQVGLALLTARDLAWVDDTHLAVLGSAAAPLTVMLTAVGGTTSPLPSIDAPATIASGDGARELYLATTSGQLFGRSGNGWRLILEGVSDPTFAG